MKRFFDAAQICEAATADPQGFIQTCEADFRNQVEQAAQTVLAQKDARLVMLAGPSSSGKTTTARLLRDAFEKSGVRAWTISLDDFYLDPSEPLLFEDGTPDYETVHSLDLPYLEESLQQLLRENRCFLPRFSFCAADSRSHGSSRIITRVW